MIEQAYGILSDNNFKLTQRRKEILQVLYNNSEKHLDIDTIYNIVKVKGKKRMGLATIYRTLELFEKIGLVSRISMEKSAAKYELTIYNKLSHHHLICVKCGLVQEISDTVAEEFKAQIERDMNFKVTDKPMKIYGYCSKCKDEAECSC